MRHRAPNKSEAFEVLDFVHGANGPRPGPSKRFRTFYIILDLKFKEKYIFFLLKGRIFSILYCRICGVFESDANNKEEEFQGEGGKAVAIASLPRNLTCCSFLEKFLG